ncbi:receptor kinase-like protein Xa21 [Oryza glaberrima]|uniref:receptor kinase-like protein Xa21 n=1 Tax=Oryza glaberrima TaxID=4538 RepID=UPI00224BE826|nr:receptor kinase-like protein Xa21 [Oryza glaberrima]
MTTTTTTTSVKLLLVFQVALICLCASSLHGDESTDRLSLAAFKEAISHDPRRALASWNASAHFCTWDGVLCSSSSSGGSGGRVVTRLNITGRGLAGRISPSLSNLTRLERLVLSGNALAGGIPASLGRLQRLQLLDLTNNTLRGVIPHQLANCSGLMALRLGGNDLVGRIPDHLAQHHRLGILELDRNELAGHIPASLANITTLNVFLCGGNLIEVVQLAGFGCGNRLTSSRFPQAILNLSALTVVSLAVNHLSGEIPSDIGNSLPNLQGLALGMNSFYGSVPDSLMNASELHLIDMSYNNFTGVIPSSIGRLTKLSFLNLEGNQLLAHRTRGWEFMNSLANCTMLQRISLATNHLEGPIPNSIGNLSNQLQLLYLGENKLSGDFPSGIANLPNLFALGLNDNQFMGELPEWLGTLKKLQAVDLSHNNFTGSIPSSLSNLSQLVYLFLNSNKFGGHLPASFGNLRVLNSLRISDNFLHGMIPREIFGIPAITKIELSSNNLSGRLPPEVGGAKQLVRLLLSSNKISGDITNTLGDCESLQYAMLDHNNFSGTIPTSLGKISSLQVLNLSRNNLAGPIPASLGNLQLLEQLDLSFNHLKGEVPTKGIFRNVTAMRIDGNPELCGGVLELHLLACPIMAINSSKKHEHSIVKKVVIPIASIVSLAIVISVMVFFKGKQKENGLSLPSFDSKFPKVSYRDLARATEGFSGSNLIGKGRYSSVYQAILFPDRTMVAVKVFSLETRGAQKSFIAECNVLRNLRHRNLVPILTACSSIDPKGNDFKALVYKFMPRGDLHALLYLTRTDANPASTPSHVTLAQRLGIMVDVADALEYLHHENQGTIIHCDLKPSNILLDDDMTAHVGDFGLSRFKVDSLASSFADSISTSSIAIKGTIGYVAPVSTAGDVYSFGIVLLEIFLRKKPTDDLFKDGLNIVRYVEMNFPDRISHIVDPDLQEDECDVSQRTSLAMKENSLECILSMLNIGLRCTNPCPNERMDMQEVAARLHGIRGAYQRGNMYRTPGTTEGQSN